LQPKVVSLPDSVGDFISARYPALLADPDKFPEIYNSAATDYGVYAAPELYGTDTTNDYVMYASVDDYIVPPQITNPDVGAEIIEEDAQKDATVATVDDYILVPMYGDAGARRAEFKTDDVLAIRKPNVGVQQTTRVDLTEVVVASGDTLYSLSRKYSVPVNDLAVINKLNPPFILKVGQKIRVPNLARVAVETTGKTTAKVVEKSKKSSVEPKSVQQKANAKKSEAKVVTKPSEKKISSDPSKKLPKINARSSSKFSWPVRGKILSNYGAKTNGLFNDGINIGATRGAVVGAAENGVVAYAGNEVKGMGNLIIIQHDGGWMTVYAHMDSMVVRRGARVSVGQKIGTVGKTGKVDSPQLHFEIRKGTKAYNPTNYLKK
jgi:murein DD-endopeptidase MepM/ murein hydrolase activator NlpD